MTATEKDKKHTKKNEKQSNRNRNRAPQRINDTECPLPGCHHTLTGNRGDRIKHILTHKNEEVCNLDIRNMAHIYKLHQCRHCTTKPSIFCSTINLNKHIDAKHPTQKDDADDFMLTFFPKSDTQRTGKWEDAFNFLAELSMTPTPHRKSLFNHEMHHTWRGKIAIEYENLTTALCSTISVKNGTHNETEPDTNGNTNVNHSMMDKAFLPLWTLFFLFEGIVLAPPSERDKTNGNKSYRRLIPERIGLLRAGHVRELYENAYGLTPTPPNERKQKDPVKSAIQRSCAAAAVENHSLAIRRLHCLPIAKNTPAAIERIKKKYFPEKCPYQTTEQPPKEESEASKAVRLLTADDNVFQKTLRGLKRGTANGPLGDSIDLLRYCGLKRDKFRHNIKMLVLEIGDDRLPKHTVQFFNPNFFFALHKQFYDDTDLRPIGIATALRRLSSAHFSVCSSPYVASKLAPLQMGIGISGGIDFITMTARMKAEKYIHKKYGRTMAFLDLTNQFNNASREKLKEILTSDFPCLLGYFNAASNPPTSAGTRNRREGGTSFSNSKDTPKGTPSQAYSPLSFSTLSRNSSC